MNEDIKDTDEIDDSLQNPFFSKRGNRSSYQKKHGPSPAFVGASWIAMLLGIVTYLIGLYNATMQLNEKGYYFTLLLFGVFAAVSLQKVVRDKIEGLPTTNIYYGICWIALCSAILLMGVGLFNAGLTKSEKGFYAMTYVLCLYSSITVQKNVRDLKDVENEE
ncbi:MAG: inner membrane protein YiaA [Clostridiaceae bacterium]